MTTLQCDLYLPWLEPEILALCQTLWVWHVRDFLSCIYTLFVCRQRRD